MQSPRARTGVRRRTMLLTFSGLVMVGVVGIGLWLTAAMRIPMITIPNPTMPSPNAFYLYTAAGKAISGSKQFNDALSSTPSVPYTLAQKEALLRQNAGVFQSVHQAFASPYLNPPDRGLGLGPSFPQYATFRELARLLAFQAKVRGEEGNWSGATESCLDCLRLGQDIPKGATVIGAYVGGACQAIGRQRMWEITDHLNVAQTRAATERLATIIDRRVPFADTLQEEKWAQQSRLLGIFGDKRYVDPFAKAAMAAQGQPDVSEMSLYYLIYNKSRIMYGCTSYMDATIAQARQPYAAKLPPPPLPSDPINKLILPVVAEGRIKIVDTETQNGLLLITLALHAYHLEHRHYPASLTELTPAYLKTLPDDPFAPKGTLLYHLQGQRYVLYSVGPDGRDDGGAPIDDPSKVTGAGSNTSSSVRYLVEKNSHGDIVAGINRW